MDHETAAKTRTLERYLLNELSEVERASFEEHYFACPVCAEDVVLTAKFLDNARQPLMAKTTAPAAPAARQDRWWHRWLAFPPKPALAGACAILLAIVVLRPAANSGAGDAPRITGSYFVTSVRSGNELRKIQVEPGQKWISLLFNRTEGPVAQYHFSLQQSPGTIVMQFDGSAPKDTDDIQVLIPVENLPSGAYSLHVRDAASNTEVALLPFQLVKR